jgi:hypothetical protein
MKKSLFLIPAILLFFLFDSCKRSESALEKNAKAYIKKEFGEIVTSDPMTFELTDSITMLQTVDQRIAFFDSLIANSKMEIADCEDLVKHSGENNLSNEGIQACFEKIKSSHTEISKNTELIDFLRMLKKSNNMDNVCAYEYAVRIGATLEPFDYVNFILLSDRNYNIIGMVRGTEKIENSPCDIPGFDRKFNEVNRKYHQ